MQLRDRVKDYIERGDALQNYLFLDFFLNTYDGSKSPAEQESEIPLRKRNVRIPYQPDHSTRCRILRTEDHEVIPFFPGRWFPRNDRPETRALYCATVLALLKPWKSLSDLKPPDETFEETFEGFMDQSPPSLHRVLENIQYFYSCSDKVDEHHQENERMEWTSVSISDRCHADDSEIGKEQTIEARLGII